MKWEMTNPGLWHIEDRVTLVQRPDERWELWLGRAGINVSPDTMDSAEARVWAMEVLEVRLAGIIKDEQTELKLLKELKNQPIKGDRPMYCYATRHLGREKDKKHWSHGGKDWDTFTTNLLGLWDLMASSCQYILVGIFEGPVNKRVTPGSVQELGVIRKDGDNLVYISGPDRKILGKVTRVPQKDDPVPSSIGNPEALPSSGLATTPENPEVG